MGRISQPHVLSEKPVMKELSKDLDQVIEGPIVAVQYPSVAPFTVSESTVTELSVKYSHLKNLDVDDKKAYKELVAAIKDVSSNRIQINKEEDAVKKPLNEFRNLILETGKKLRAKFKPLEDSLKAEKDRIDTVLADREAAQRKVWQDNLDELKSLYMRIDHNMKHSELNHLFGTIDKDNVLESDFGDLLEEAKTLKESIFERIKASIKYKKEQAEFEAKRIAFEKEQAEAAERERIAKEEREAMLKQIEELKKAAETSPEIQTLKDIDHSEIAKNKDVVIDSSFVDMASGPDESVSAVVKTDENGSIESIKEVKQTEERYIPSKPKNYPDLTIDKHYADDDPIQEAKLISYSGTLKDRPAGLESVGNINGDSALCMFIATLARANNMRVITITKEKYDAVERVKSTLVKAIDYLEQFDNDGEN